MCKIRTLPLPPSLWRYHSSADSLRWCFPPSFHSSKGKTIGTVTVKRYGENTHLLGYNLTLGHQFERLHLQFLGEVWEVGACQKLYVRVLSGEQGGPLKQSHDQQQLVRE